MTGDARITGSLRLLLLFDVCEELRMDKLRAILQQGVAERGKALGYPAPAYVQFEQSPVVEPAGSIEVRSGERFTTQIHYFPYGVACLVLELPFHCRWREAVELAAHWIWSTDLERVARSTIKARLDRVADAMVKRYETVLYEDYFVVQVRPIAKPDTTLLSASELIADRGLELAQIVRGEPGMLSTEEKSEVLQSTLSYSPTDLVVAGWTAAVIYDTDEGAQPALQLLEYANTQLLVLRHYDETLTHVLNRVYASLEKGTGVFARWRLAREAKHLNTIRLEVRELTERVDNSIKFLSDMYAARVYRLAANKIGVPDYRRLVDEKLNTAGELYRFMMDEFHQGRAFVLELTIVIILIIDLVFLFRGKT